MAKPRTLIRLESSIKSLLKDKTNFDILEGFLGALLEDESIQVIELLERENKKPNSILYFNKKWKRPSNHY